MVFALRCGLGGYERQVLSDDGRVGCGFVFFGFWLLGFLSRRVSRLQGDRGWSVV
jgi:hypothetical protein